MNLLSGLPQLLSFSQETTRESGSPGKGTDLTPFSIAPDATADLQTSGITSAPLIAQVDTGKVQ